MLQRQHGQWQEAIKDLLTRLEGNPELCKACHLDGRNVFEVVSLVGGPVIILKQLVYHNVETFQTPMRKCGTTEVQESSDHFDSQTMF